MKSSLVLLSLVYTAISSPLVGEQVPFGAGLVTSYPGFTLDLNAQRLVQTEGREPVWMTELDKVFYNRALGYYRITLFIAQVRAKAQGVKFFDM